MEYKPSQAQAAFLECLMALGMSKDGIMVIMLLIPEDWQIAEMADFLLKNKDAKETEIIEEAIRLSEMEES